MPYLGTGAVMVPWILYVFFAQGNIVLGIGLSILYGVIVVARQIMEPKVLASSVGLDPLGNPHCHVRWSKIVWTLGAHYWPSVSHLNLCLLSGENFP